MMDPMELFRSEVRASLNAALTKLGIDLDYELETPPMDVSDFAVPCFPFAKKVRKAPTQIAEDIASAIVLTERLEKVWADRGYVNFRVNHSILSKETLETILRERGGYGRAADKG
jgi:arginyl-tRNA synthetase